MNTERGNFSQAESRPALSTEQVRAQELLANIMHDRRQGRELPAGETQINLPDWQECSPDQIKRIILNLEIISELNGHRGSELRQVMQNGKSESSRYLKKLYDWSLSPASDLAEIADLEPTALLATGWDKQNEIFERVDFSENHQLDSAQIYDKSVAGALAKSLGLPAETKWQDMVGKVFNAGDQSATLKRIIKEVGFIPTQLLTKQKFRGLGAKPVIGAIESLRDLEKDRSLARPAQFERAKLINFLITSDNANEIRKIKGEKNITLDANGLFINLRGFHAHLPFGLINDDLAQKLLADNWVDASMMREISLRRAEANSDISGLEKLKELQLAEYPAAAGTEDSGAETEKVRVLVQEISADPESYGRKLVLEDLIIPDAVIVNFLREAGPEGISVLMLVAETIGLEISEESELENDADFHGKKLDREIAQSYDHRSKVLNSPAYYNATKIIRAILAWGLNAKPQEQFLAIRGQYKRSKQGDQHSFIETIDRGRLARVLINEDKHLNQPHKINLENIPLFDRAQYDQLEASLMTFDHFTKALNRMNELLGAQPAGWENDFDELAQSANHFLLSNVTEYYQPAKDLLDNSGLGGQRLLADRQKLADLLNLLDQAHERYAKFFYENIGSVADYRQKFSPEVTVMPAVFGREALSRAKERCSEDGYSPELFDLAKDFQTTVVKVRHKINDPSETIPHHLREECLDAIKLLRDRPLINVIGGCRHLENQPGEDPLDQFATAVIEAGHKYRANIGVPPTQSGIGVTFGKKNIEYKNQFGDLRLAEQAHLFSISPAANTEFIGNDYPDRAVREETFALTAVDSIITPTNGDWDLKGREKLRSRYFNHIAYMEALYDQMSQNQPKLVVVGNGGLYSIAELNESLERGFEAMLISDSGRFAEVASVLLERIDEIDLDDNARAEEQILEMIKSSRLDKKVKDEYQQKDFGFQARPENEDYEVYRMFLNRFLKLAKGHRDKIKTTTLNDLANNLDGYLAS